MLKLCRSKLISIFAIFCMLMNMVMAIPAYAGNFGTISGYVWLDSNGNGIMDTGEPKVSGIDITITNKGGHPWGTPSDSNGYYIYNAFNNGYHIVSVDLQKLQSKGYKLTKMGGDSKINPSSGKSNSIKPSNDGMNIGLIKSDNTPPTGNITSNITGWTNNNVILTCIGSDSESGVNSIQKPDGTWVTGATATYTVTSNGNYSFNIKDNSGNVGTASIAVINIDKVAPTSPIININTSGVVIITPGMDSGAGVSKTQYSILLNGVITKDWTDYSGTFNLSGTGNFTVQAKTIDNVGNVSNIAQMNSQSSNLPQVNIDISDASGLRDKYTADSSNNSERLDKFLSPSVTIKGDAYANISFMGNNLDFFQYQFINSANNPQTMPSDGWQNINLTQQTVNDDVVTDQQGYLNWRGYDVNHLPTLTDDISWSNPELVFKYPYAATSTKSAAYSQTVSDYGKWANIVPYTVQNVNGETITVNKRWDTNLVFMSYLDIGGDYKEASKFWGYIKVPVDGDYSFGAQSDDGSRGYITVDGVTSKFVDMFHKQWTTTGSVPDVNHPNVYHLKANTYYPIYMEYFNWGGQAEFRLLYECRSKNSEDWQYNVYWWGNVPTQWLYPSKNITPGEYATTIFTGSQGVKLPSEAGKYYIAFKAGKGTDVQREGFYGPFVVERKANFELSRYIDSSNNTIGDGSEFELKYKIQPKDINVSDIYPNGQVAPSTYTITTNNFSYQDTFPQGLAPVDKNNPKVVINGQKVNGNLDVSSIVYQLDSTGTKYTAQPITYSIWLKENGDNIQSYLLSGQNSIITYTDINNAQSQNNFPDFTLNLGGYSSLLKQGAFMKNNAYGDYIYEGYDGELNAVSTIPIDLAMVVDVKSYNPQITLNISGSYKEQSITFKKYELSNGLIDINSLQVATFDAPSVDFSKDDNFTFQEGKKYIIVYTITPTGEKDSKININTTIDKQQISQSIILSIQELPELQ